MCMPYQVEIRGREKNRLSPLLWKLLSLRFLSDDCAVVLEVQQKFVPGFVPINQPLSYQKFSDATTSITPATLTCFGSEVVWVISNKRKSSIFPQVRIHKRARCLPCLYTYECHKYFFITRVLAAAPSLKQRLVPDTTAIEHSQSHQQATHGESLSKTTNFAASTVWTT